MTIVPRETPSSTPIDAAARVELARYVAHDLHKALGGWPDPDTAIERDRQLQLVLNAETWESLLPDLLQVRP